MSARAGDLFELSSPADGEIVRRVLAGDIDVYEVIMRRHNQRLDRAARAILRDDAEAEDVIQEACIRAYQHLRDFAGDCCDRVVGAVLAALRSPARSNSV